MCVCGHGHVYGYCDNDCVCVCVWPWSSMLTCHNFVILVTMIRMVSVAMIVCAVGGHGLYIVCSLFCSSLQYGHCRVGIFV